MSNRITPIRQYLHNGGIYYHEMDLNSDTVIVKDFEGQHLLIFDSSARLYDVSGLSKEALHGVLNRSIKHNMPMVGHCALNDDQDWVFHADGVEIVSKFNLRQVEGLLDFEIDIAKWWMEKYPYIVNKDNLHPKPPMCFTQTEIDEASKL